MKVEGHDSGHAALEPPAGFSWQTYVEHFVTELGGWTALADEVVRRASGTADAPMDLLSVEKGLRRLARREHRPGGQYGRWLRFRIMALNLLSRMVPADEARTITERAARLAKLLEDEDLLQRIARRARTLELT